MFQGDRKVDDGVKDKSNRSANATEDVNDFRFENCTLAADRSRDVSANETSNEIDICSLYN